MFSLLCSQVFSFSFPHRFWILAIIPDAPSLKISIATHQTVNCLLDLSSLITFPFLLFPSSLSSSSFAVHRSKVHQSSFVLHRSNAQPSSFIVRHSSFIVVKSFIAHRSKALLARNNLVAVRFFNQGDLRFPRRSKITAKLSSTSRPRIGTLEAWGSRNTFTSPLNSLPLPSEERIFNLVFHLK